MTVSRELLVAPANGQAGQGGYQLSQGQAQGHGGAVTCDPLQEKAAVSAWAGEPGPCRRCGGSGTLRHGDQRYRTCLDCLGQGLLVTLISGRLPATRPISSVASVSHAG